MLAASLGVVLDKVRVMEDLALLDYSRLVNVSKRGYFCAIFVLPMKSLSAVVYERDLVSFREK